MTGQGTMLICGLGHVVTSCFTASAGARVRGIKIQDLVELMRFSAVLSLVAIRRADELNWAVEGCLGWKNYEFWTWVVRGVPENWRRGQ